MRPCTKRSRRDEIASSRARTDHSGVGLTWLIVLSVVRWSDSQLIHAGNVDTSTVSVPLGENSYLPSGVHMPLPRVVQLVQPGPPTHQLLPSSAECPWPSTMANREMSVAHINLVNKATITAQANPALRSHEWARFGWPKMANSRYRVTSSA